MKNTNKAHNNNKQHIVLRAKNINITYRMAKQGFLTMSIPEIEIWREQD